MGLEKEMMGEGLGCFDQVPGEKESELRARADVLKRSKELFIESPALHSSTWFFFLSSRARKVIARARVVSGRALFGGRIGDSVRP